MGHIEQLRIEDAEHCWQIWDEIQREYPYPAGGNWSLSQIQYELKNYNGTGFFSLDPKRQLEAFYLSRALSETEREIMLLATRPKAQRTGAMGQLVRNLIGNAKEPQQIWLEVHEANHPAVQFYHNLGFQLIRQRSQYYRDGGGALVFEYKPLQ